MYDRLMCLVLTFDSRHDEYFSATLGHTTLRFINDSTFFFFHYLLLGFPCLLQAVFRPSGIIWRLRMSSGVSSPSMKLQRETRRKESHIKSTCTRLMG